MCVCVCVYVCVEYAQSGARREWKDTNWSPRASQDHDGRHHLNALIGSRMPPTPVFTRVTMSVCACLCVCACACVRVHVCVCACVSHILRKRVSTHSKAKARRQWKATRETRTHTYTHMNAQIHTHKWQWKATHETVYVTASSSLDHATHTRGTTHILPTQPRHHTRETTRDTTHVHMRRHTYSICVFLHVSVSRLSNT